MGSLTMKDRARHHQTFEALKPVINNEVFKQALLARREAEVAARIQQIREEDASILEQVGQHLKAPAFSTDAQPESSLPASLPDPPHPSPGNHMRNQVASLQQAQQDVGQPATASEAPEPQSGAVPERAIDKPAQVPHDGGEDHGDQQYKQEADDLQQYEAGLLAKQTVRSQQLGALRAKLDELAASKRELADQIQQVRSSCGRPLKGMSTSIYPSWTERVAR